MLFTKSAEVQHILYGFVHERNQHITWSRKKNQPSIYCHATVCILKFSSICSIPKHTLSNFVLHSIIYSFSNSICYVSCFICVHFEIHSMNFIAFEAFISLNAILNALISRAAGKCKIIIKSSIQIMLIQYFILVWMHSYRTPSKMFRLKRIFFPLPLICCCRNWKGCTNGCEWQETSFAFIVYCCSNFILSFWCVFFFWKMIFFRW